PTRNACKPRSVRRSDAALGCMRMASKQPSALRSAPAIWAAIGHLLLMAGAFALFLGGKPGRFRSQAIIDAIPGFYTHVFNFSLSYLLYAGIGFLWLM